MNKALEEASYIVLSPGVSVKKSKYRRSLIKYKEKIITDIDLIFLLKNFFKSIVVTGTNGKSTTCKIINHVLKKNGFKTLLGGNIGTPALDLNIKKRDFLIIEASSFQLALSDATKEDATKGALPICQPSFVRLCLPPFVRVCTPLPPPPSLPFSACRAVIHDEKMERIHLRYSQADS